MKKKPVEIKNLEECLASVPEEDRAGLREQITKMFSEMDPSKPIGRPVEWLPKGPTNCLGCGKLLKPATGRTIRVPHPDGKDKLVKLYDCVKCDRVYQQEVAN